MEFIRINNSKPKITYSDEYIWHSLKNTSDLKELEYDQVEMTIKEKGRYLFQKNNPNLLPRIYISELNIIQLNGIIVELEGRYSHQFVHGFICDDLDKGLQNDDDVKYMKRKLGKIPQYVKIIQNPNYQIGKPGLDMIVKEYISIESLPGHSHLMDYEDKLWFGSCWQMYFSPIYYKYIPKPLFDGFKDCYQNIVLKNGLRIIKLFQNGSDYDLPENRQLQWVFRKELGIDSIAHELTKQNNRIEPSDLPVLITKQNCELGQTRVIRYLDKNDKLVSPIKAVKKETKEYLEDGITIVLEQNEKIQNTFWDKFL